VVFVGFVAVLFVTYRRMVTRLETTLENKASADDA
jgi:hypothetical protein